MVTRFGQYFDGGKLMPLGLLVALAGCGGGSSGSSGGDTDPEPESAALVLSGTIDMAFGTRVDEDNGDSLGAGARLLTEAQALPDEFVLAGYVSADAGSYPDGGWPYDADPLDSYTMTLVPGQAVTLQALETQAGQAPLTLTIYQGGNPVVSATTEATQGSQVSVTLPDIYASGTYTLEVEPEASSPTLYILSSDLSGAIESVVWNWPDHEFVAGEAVVSFNTSGTLRAASAATALSTSVEPVRELGAGIWHVRAPASVQQASARQLSDEEETLAWIRELRQDPDIASATPNYRMRAQATPALEPAYEWQQWNYDLVQAPAAWQLATTGGDGVTVAVLDTGLYGSPGSWHGDLNANVVIPDSETVDYVSETYDIDSEPGYDSNPSDPGDLDGESVYHGTHVAGIVAAAVNDYLGTGLAYGADLLPVRVLGESGEGSSTDLLAALNWLADSDTPRAQVVNMSLGGLPYMSSLYDAIQAGVDQGIIYVAAAGNGGASDSSYPAAFDNVLAVSAVAPSGDLASYSNFGDWVDLAAPGGEYSSGDGKEQVVYSTSAKVNDSGQLVESWRVLQGTSMAAPHVSAAVALMKSVNSNLTHAQLVSALEAGELTDCDSPCTRTQELGWGILDAGAAVTWALDNVNSSVPLILSSSPSSVTFSTEGQSSETLVLEASGSDTGSVTIESVTSGAPWLLVDDSSVTGQSGTRFELPLTLDAARLPEDSSERTSVTVTYLSDEQRTLEIPVTGQQVSDLELRNAGRHFVLLVDPVPEDGEYATVAQASVVVDAGEYHFSLSLDGVEPGSYLLVAGSDLDNDGRLCHAGEACAEYPAAGLREEISVSGDSSVTGLTMTTSYSRPVISGAYEKLLPRPGFAGYSLLTEDTGESTLKGIAP